MADINSTLRKVKALADGTSNENERNAALDKFYELMEKHGVSESDLEDEAVTTHDFKWKGERERTLLKQILYKVLNSTDFTSYTYRRGGRKVSNLLGIDCTKAQKLEVDFLFDFYKELYRREEESFYTAFVQKHHLFGNPSEGEGEELSLEEYLKYRQMMGAMDDSSPHRQLAVND